MKSLRSEFLSLYIGGLSLVLLSGCSSLIVLPSSGTWETRTVLLGPVVVCRGGNFSMEPKDCNQWPLSIPTMPSPEIHYAELRAKAAELYETDPTVVVLKDVNVKYTTEINGVIRGWRATAIAGKRVE